MLPMFLGTASVLISLISFILFVLVDIFKSYRPQFPDFPIFLLGLLANILAAPCAHLAGKLQYSHYSWWQPTIGGTIYITLQGIGWLLYAASILVSSILLINLQQVKFNGAICATGGLGVASTIIIATSINYFEEKEARQMRSSRRAALYRLFQGETAVATFLSLGALLVFTTIDHASLWSRAFELAAMFTNIVTIVYIHCHLGPSRHVHYTLWQPLMGGIKFVSLQAVGWTGSATAIYMNIVGASDVSRIFNKSGMMGGIGMLSFMSNMLLLLSLNYFDPLAAVEARASEAKRWTGERVVCFLVALFSTACMIGVDVMLFWGWERAFNPFYMSLTAAIALFSVTPVMHWLGGYRQYETFRMWQPFEGGTLFVLLQAFGWFFYSIALGLTILFLVNFRGNIGISSLAVTAFGAHVVVAYSLLYYDDYAPKSSRSIMPYTSNGELWVSLFLGMGGLALFLVVSVLHAELTFPTVQVLAIAVVALCLATPMAHYSGKNMHEYYPLIQPFAGGSEFAALQVVGWTSYGFIILFYVMFLLHFDSLGMHADGGYGVVCGIVGVVPYAFIMLSLRTYKPPKRPSDHRLVKLHLHSRDTHLCDNLDLDIQELKSLLASTERPLVSAILTSTIQQLTKKQTKPKLKPKTSSAQEEQICISTILGPLLSIGSLSFYILSDILPPLQSSPISVTFFGLASLCMAGAPIITHGLGGHARHPDYAIWQPFKGGFQFVLWQALGWCLIALSAVISIAVGCTLESPTLGLLTFTGFAGFVGHTMILISLSQFQLPNEDVADSLVDKSFFTSHAEAVVAFILALAAFMLYFVAYILKTHYNAIFIATPFILMASMLFFATIPLAYVSTRHHTAKPRHDPEDEHGHTIPPLEVVGWVSSLIAFCFVVISIYYAVIHFIPYRFIFATGVVIIGSQLMFFLSVVSEDQDYAGQLDSIFSSMLTILFYALPFEIVGFWLALVLSSLGFGSIYFLFTIFIFHPFVPMIIPKAAFVWNVIAISSTAILILHAMWHWTYMDAAWLVLTLLCILAQHTDADISGCRQREWIIRSPFWGYLVAYFSLKLIREDELDPSQKYIFGYHPHGIWPLTCIWATMSRTWQDNFDGIRVSGHGATILFRVPFLKDVLHACNVREVKREALHVALDQGNSPLLVPGGQAEMRYSKSSTEEVVVLTRHKGFIALAIQRGVPLVPVFSFGEWCLMDDVGRVVPRVQKFFTRLLGFGYPHFPYGRWGLPLPRRKALTLVVGKPISTPCIPKPSQEDIDAVHKLYFEELSRIFEKHKKEAGFEKCEIRYTH